MMKRSTNHILTTHTGSLPRPTDLVDMVLRKEEKQAVDEDVLAMRVRSAVAEVVRRQAEVGSPSSMTASRASLVTPLT